MKLSASGVCHLLDAATKPLKQKRGTPPLQSLGTTTAQSNRSLYVRLLALSAPKLLRSTAPTLALTRWLTGGLQPTECGTRRIRGGTKSDEIYWQLVYHTCTDRPTTISVVAVRIIFPANDSSNLVPPHVRTVPHLERWSVADSPWGVSLQEGCS